MSKENSATYYMKDMRDMCTIGNLRIYYDVRPDEYNSDIASIMEKAANEIRK